MIATSTIVGIDPGTHGAIGVLNESDELLEVVDMPSTPEANGRTATHAPLLAGILARVRARLAFCELVGARAEACLIGLAGLMREAALRSAGEPRVRQSSRGSERSSPTRRPACSSALARRR
jgi:hypothetical protein